MFKSKKHLHVEVNDPAEPISLAGMQDALDQILDRGDSGPVDAVDLILLQAVHHRASDLYLEPWKEALVIRFRIDGTLHDVARVPHAHRDRLIARLKVSANIVTYQKGVPLDGRIEPSPAILDRSMRVSIYPTIHGEKAVVRVLDSEVSLPTLDGLGFADDIVDELRRWTERPQGTLLLTGPSAAGKTTTIYALLREMLNQPRRSRHIVTIEDPVEYHLNGVTQSQIAPAQEFTYDAALRSVLRQDPDVLMVGEIRDSETARAAIKAGLTGHLVVSTIHSVSSVGVFSRLLDMGVEPYLIASSINGVLSQRLVRKICPDCAIDCIPDMQQRTRFGVEKESIRFKMGEGCDACQGIGYRARTVIGEWLKVDSTITELVLKRTPTHLIQDAAIESGMRTLLSQGIESVRAGVTTLDELELVVFPEDYRS